MTGDEPFRSGYVALLGRPNAGKSTFLNTVLGEKMAIVTPKAQTTRRQVRGILTGEHSQIVFVDTPGYHEAESLFNKALVAQALEALDDADLVLYLLDAPKGITRQDALVFEILREKRKPLLCAVNKIDAMKKTDLFPLLEELSKRLPWKEIVPVSALTGDGVQVLIEAVRGLLPQGPPYYPADQISDANERFRAAEVVREKLFLRMREELPYGIAVEIESFEENPGLNRIRAKIFVERESQKGMVIGKGGKELKAVGTAAREELETIWGKKVFLELHVGVLKNWTKDPAMLRRFGYSPQKEQR